MEAKEELTFKEFIDKLKFIFSETLRRWVITGMVLLPFLAFFIYKHSVHKISYSTELKFVVEGGTSLGSGVGGLLGQIGLKSGGSGALNNYKILEVGKSKLILNRILFEKYNGDYLANFIVKNYELDKKWSEENKEFENFRFTSDNINTFSPNEKLAYNSLCLILLKGTRNTNPLLTIKLNEDTGIFSINSESVDEGLTLHLSKLNFEKLKYFFETELINSQTKTTAILKNKVDSLQYLIQSKTSEIANIQDRTYGLVMASPAIRRTALEKEIQGLLSAQSEFIKSYEMADIGLKDIRKSFIIIDEGNAPLEPIESSIILSILKALVLGGFFAILIQTFINLYKGNF